MSDTTGADNTNAAATNPPANPPVEDPKVETVPVNSYNEVKSDMLKYKQELRAKEAELEKARQKQKELELAGHRAKEDWKAMYEDAENRFKQADTDLKQTRGAVVDSTKWSHLSAELTGLGIIPGSLKAAERLADLNKLDVETTSHGRYSVLNAKEYAEQFKAEHPYMFQAKGANINTGTGSTLPPGKMDLKRLEELRAQYAKTRSQADEQAYKKALLQMKGVQ